MATAYEGEKISAHDAAQISEHHTKPSAVATMDPERRRQVEKSLKRKLDARCSLFVLIYIMNCRGFSRYAVACLVFGADYYYQISTETTLLQRVWAVLKKISVSLPHNTRHA